MTIYGPLLVDDDRVVPPCDAVRADDIGNLTESIDHFFGFGDVRLDIFSVRRDGHEPVPAERSEQIPVRKKRSGIFAAEDDQVDHFRIELVPRDGERVERVAHEDILLPETIREPLRVKGRDIGPHPRLDYHFISPLRSSYSPSFLIKIEPILDLYDTVS